MDLVAVVELLDDEVQRGQLRVRHGAMDNVRCESSPASITHDEKFVKGDEADQEGQKRCADGQGLGRGDPRQR
jgi:hypothetical protein